MRGFIWNIWCWFNERCPECGRKKDYGKCWYDGIKFYCPVHNDLCPVVRELNETRW